MPPTIAGLGARTDLVATVPHLDPVQLRLTPEEGRLLELVGGGRRIDEVVARSGLEESRAIAVLQSLRAKGAIAPTAAVDPALSEQVELEPERKREILELERALEVLDHFAVLGVRRGAPPAEVKKAFYNASQRFHPDRFYGKNLGSFRARVEHIFLRMSEAHSTLTDPKLREEYLQKHPELTRPTETPPPMDPESAERRAERQARLARHPYLARTHRLTELITRGKAAMARGDFERAHTDLNQALALDSKNKELIALLAEVRRYHDSQRAKAEIDRGGELERGGDLSGAYAAYRRALQVDTHSADAAFRAARAARALNLDAAEVRTLAQTATDLAPGRVECRLFLAQLLVELGAKRVAKHHYETVLKQDPENAEARAALRKPWWPF